MTKQLIFWDENMQSPYIRTVLSFNFTLNPYSAIANLPYRVGFRTNADIIKFWFEYGQIIFFILNNFFNIWKSFGQFVFRFEMFFLLSISYIDLMYVVIFTKDLKAQLMLNQHTSVTGLVF